MKCIKCGAEISGNDIYCGNCGEKLAQEKNPQTTEKKPQKKKMFRIAVCAVILVIAAAAGILFFGQPEEIELEAKDLGTIDDQETKDRYAGDILYVHGYLARSLDDSYYVLYSDADSEEGIAFKVESGLDEELGDGSELIVKGTLGNEEDTPSLTFLFAEEIQVIEKVEPVYAVGFVEDLLADVLSYDNKKVSVMGMLDQASGTCMLWDSYEENVVLLAGVTREEANAWVEDWSFCNVIGIFRLSSDGVPVIDVERME